jgi:hypothetical protein
LLADQKNRTISNQKTQTKKLKKTQKNSKKLKKTQKTHEYIFICIYNIVFIKIKTIFAA